MVRRILDFTATAVTLLVLPAIYTLIARRQARREAAARTST
jgi:Cu/Ag efflux pump CusA